MPPRISVTAPLQPAFQHTARLLFRPLDPTKWFVIGFCAWLAGLGEGAHFNMNFGGGDHGGGGNIRHELEAVRDFVLGNLVWIIPLTLTLVLLVIAFSLLILWISSRGKFMFLYCVAWERAEVSRPWREYSNQANSLFFFRLILGVIAIIPILSLIALLSLDILSMVSRGQATVPGVLIALSLFVTLLGAALLLGLIWKLTYDFIVPIMYLQRRGCIEGWRALLVLAGTNPGTFVRYLLFQIVIVLGTGAIVLGAVLITCCLAGCLFALPYLGTVLLLPILVFKRAYSIYFLAQYGPGYDVFPPPQTV